MALQRQNPLPPGRYWQDIFHNQLPAFQDWLVRNRASVRAVATEDKGIDFLSGYHIIWYLFEVTAPTRWEGPGIPTIADAGVQSSQDTVQKPTVQDPVETLAQWTSGAGSTLSTILVLGVVGAGAYLAIKMTRKK